MLKAQNKLQTEVGHYCAIMSYKISSCCGHDLVRAKQSELIYICNKARLTLQSCSIQY